MKPLYILCARKQVKDTNPPRLLNRIFTDPPFSEYLQEGMKQLVRMHYQGFSQNLLQRATHIG